MKKNICKLLIVLSVLFTAVAPVYASDYSDKQHWYDSLCTDQKVTGLKDTFIDGKTFTTLSGNTITEGQVKGKKRMYVFFKEIKSSCVSSGYYFPAVYPPESYWSDPSIQIIMFTPESSFKQNLNMMYDFTKYNLVMNVSIPSIFSKYSTYPTMVFIDENDNVTSITTGERIDPEFYQRIYGYHDVQGIHFTDSETPLAVHLNVGFNVLFYRYPVFSPENASNQLLSWQSSDTSIATVKNGQVTGIKSGTVTITATTLEGNKTASYTAMVGPELESFAMNTTKVVEMNAGDTYQLNPTYVPEDTPDRGIKYSYDTSIISIENDTIKALKEGATTVIASPEYSNVFYAPQFFTVTVNGTSTPTNKPILSKTNTEMYRLYNPNSGEHFYTKDSNERNHLVSLGWVYEGVGWNAPSTSSTPVYRVYNPNAGDHHYTMNANEKDSLVAVGWIYEGIGWYSDDAKSVPLYRQYNPNAVAGAHNYTVNANERDMLVGAGWSDEGIGWYGA